MKCENCGEEILNHAKFCPHCGAKTSLEKVEGKSVIVALMLSFILAGTGIAYAGKRQKGISLFFIGVIFAILAIRVRMCTVLALIVWIYSLHETYKEARVANGASNPSLVGDIRGFSTNKKIAAVVAISLIILIFVGGVIAAFSPESEDYDDLSQYFIFSDDGSLDNDDHDSEGDEVSYHYEDEYGSSDTGGKAYDDGSVESHQSGSGDYEDYQIDSYMDGDGNICGTLENGGKTYYIED